MATLSNDLRERIVAACDRGDATRAQIADRYNVSLGMVKKFLQQRKRTGDIGPRHRFSGAKPKITPIINRDSHLLFTSASTAEERLDALLPK